MQQILPQIRERGATLWALSTDSLAESQALAQRLKLTFPLGVDPELRIIRQYGVEMADRPIAVPATFVLRAGDGQIVYRYIGESIFDRPAAEAILKSLEQARR